METPDAESLKQQLVNQVSKVIEDRLQGEDGAKISVLLKAISGLMKGDVDALKEMASQLGDFDMDKIGKVIDLLKKFSSGMLTGKAKEIAELAGKLTKSADDIFEQFDVDNSGSIT